MVKKKAKKLTVAQRRAKTNRYYAKNKQKYKKYRATSKLAKKKVTKKKK